MATRAPQEAESEIIREVAGHQLVIGRTPDLRKDENGLNLSVLVKF
jgi:hypothetical protein